MHFIGGGIWSIPDRKKNSITMLEFTTISHVDMEWLEGSKCPKNCQHGLFT